jgi:hypothetical protein
LIGQLLPEKTSVNSRLALLSNRKMHHGERGLPQALDDRGHTPHKEAGQADDDDDDDDDDDEDDDDEE